MFSFITLQVKVVLMSQYLFVFGAKPFPVNQNVKYVCLHSAFQNHHSFADSFLVTYGHKLGSHAAEVGKRTGSGNRFSLALAADCC